MSLRGECLVLANRLKELRKQKDISQQKLAEIVGKTQQAVNLWEKGENEPSIEAINIMADYFGVTTDYLLGRRNYYVLSESSYVYNKNGQFYRVNVDMPADDLNIDEYMTGIKTKIYDAVGQGVFELDDVPELLDLFNALLTAQVESKKKKKVNK